MLPTKGRMCWSWRRTTARLPETPNSAEMSAVLQVARVATKHDVLFTHSSNNTDSYVRAPFTPGAASPSPSGGEAAFVFPRPSAALSPEDVSAAHRFRGHPTTWSALVAASAHTVDVKSHAWPSAVPLSDTLPDHSRTLAAVLTNLFVPESAKATDGVGVESVGDTEFADLARAIRSRVICRMASFTAVDVLRRGSDGWTAAMIAVVQLDVDMLETVLSLLPTDEDRREMVNAVNDECDTCLHLALRGQPHPRMLSVLMSNGADPYLRSRYGETTIEYLKRRVKAGGGNFRHAGSLLRLLLGTPLDAELSVCSVCMESDVEYTLACGHRFCYDCVLKHVLCCVKDGATYDRIACPAAPECTAVMEYTTINRVLISHSRERELLERRSRDTCLALQPDFSWCPNCAVGGYVVPTDGCQTIFCSSCPASWCKECRFDHQPSLSCDAYRASLDFRSVEWMASHAKKCPQCKMPGVKESGCSHVKCALCGYEVCWVCMGPYIPYTYTYGDTCTCKAKRAEMERAAVSAASSTTSRAASGGGGAMTGALTPAAASGAGFRRASR